MSRRLLFLPLLGSLPALLCAQQPKLINCRTLEAAGNFVGPDEVIVDDLVCQKAKPGAQTNFSAQVPKAVPGVLISGDDSSSVVDAAKAASKRVAAAKDAIREKTEPAGEQVTPAVPPTAPPPSAASLETPATAAPSPEPAKTPEAPPTATPEMNLPLTPPRPIVAETPHQPAPDAGATAANPPSQAPIANDTANADKSQPAGSAEIPATPPAHEAVSNFTGGGEKTALPEASASPKANESAASAPKTAPPQPPTPTPEAPPSAAPSQPAVTAAPEPTHTEPTPPAQQVTAPEPAAAEPAASPEKVLKSAPPAEQPVPANNAAPAGEPPPAASSATPVAEAPKPTEPAAPAGATGFYDANAGTKVVTTPRPGDPANAPAGLRKPSETEIAAAAAAKAAAEEAEASLRAPDPNLPRERVVETGGFAEPKEVGPDPTTLAHKTTFQPGDIEGFEEGHRSGCTKNITVAGLKGEKLVLGTPGWATRWIEKNQKRMPQICFSDTPMTSAKNYLIVFYTAPLKNTNVAQPADPAAMPQGAPAGGVGAFTLSYGSTWHYAQERTVGVTVLTRDESDEPQADLGKVWYATAYTEEGVPVSEHWPEKAKKQIHVDEKDTKSKKAREARTEMERVSDDLLDQMVGDIAKL